MATKPTRRMANSEPINVFEDGPSFHPVAPSMSRAPMPSFGKQRSPNRVLQNANRSAVFNPPSGHVKHSSPHKAHARSMHPLSNGRPNKLNVYQISPPQSSTQGTDSVVKMPMSHPFPRPGGPKGMQMNHDKENAHYPIYPAPQISNGYTDTFYSNHPNNPRLLDAAPIAESRPAKRVKTGSISAPAPAAAFGEIIDDGQKPNHSYAQLIGMAILRSSHKRLTLSQIYKWISDHYKFYGEKDAGWQNSIRHNLSLNKAFIKQERPKDDPGKGNYWAIAEGMEEQFLKDKPSRKANAASENMHIMAIPPPPRPNYPAFEATSFHDGQPSLPALPPLPAFPAANGMSRPNSSQTALPTAPEVSSDATIPPSDNCPDDEVERTHEVDVHAQADIASPLPQLMHSSPPMPSGRPLYRRHTPRPSNEVPIQATTHYRGQKRKADDSGYLSSMESSSVRRDQQSRILSSASHRRARGARAEDEIARLRSSLSDSPTMSRSYGGALPSSSPVRQPMLHSVDGQILPPYTPLGHARMPPPAIPPASVSPSTNLERHRRRVSSMLESPLRKVQNSASFAMIPPWGSPANHEYVADMGMLDGAFALDSTIDFLGLDGLMSVSVGADGSPVKRPMKRARLERSQSTSVLSDITNSAVKRTLIPTPALKYPTSDLGYNPESPSKVFGDMPIKVLEDTSPASNPYPQGPLGSLLLQPNLGLNLLDNDWADMLTQSPAGFFQPEEVDGGMDLLQGYQKIGGGASQSVQRPPTAQ
ncbi:hypothetical protein F5Y16DRAFT_294702 [Xylariaceae sp. FL0255]|nr:hypothetical protein F5Y16DRAFT_294702 [Xylariaceae sp. FL0255]